MNELEAAERYSGDPAPAARRLPIGLRTQLALLVLAASLPLLILTVVLAVRSYHTEREQMEEHTVDTAHALALAVDRELAGLQSALVALSLSQELRNGNLEVFYDQSKELLDRVPAVNISLASPDGQQILNTRASYGQPLPKQTNLATLQRAIEAGEPVVSDLFVGAVTKRPKLSIDMPVQTELGPLVLSIGVPPELLNEILLQQRLPQSWIVSLLDSSGTIVARTKAPEKFLGQKAAPGLLKALETADEGTAEMETLEGISVLAAFSRSSISGWMAAIGVPGNELAAPLRRSLYAIAAVAAILLLGGMALAAFIARRIEQPIQALVEPALALGRGERLSIPPLRLREAHQLGRAMKTAASLLHARERQRDRAEAQLRESELRFRTMADSAPVMIWMCGPDGKSIYFNRVWLEFTGRVLDEELGQGWAENVHAEDSAALAEI
ncbi:MAG TPA: cache domain-containing protein, partial [Alphaproteobacteria bacterium]